MMMTDIYAEIGETSKGQRIILHGPPVTAPDGSEVMTETMWNDTYSIKTIPGRKWDRGMRRWTLPVSWPSCVVMRSTFGDRLKVKEGLAAWARSQRDQRERALFLRELKEIDGLSYYWDESNDHDAKMFPYQIPGRDFLVTAKSAIMGDEMGLGKTFQTLGALRLASMMGEAYPALIVCPNSLKRNWEREVKQWLPEANPFVIQGNATQRRKQLEEAVQATNAVIIMNTEVIRLHSRLTAWGGYRLAKCTECATKPEEGTPDLKPSACETHPKELNSIEFQVCVLDEAHRVKDPKAKQTRAIWNVFHGASVRYRWALTGTPVANHPGDLWSILNTIAPESFPAKSAFEDRYALTEYNPFGGRSIVGLNPDRKEEFFQLIDPHFRRMIKADVLKSLPDKVYIRHDVEMSPKQAKAYKDIEKELVTVLDDGSVLVANGSLPGATRLLQFASAYCEIDKEDANYVAEEPETWKVQLTDVPKSPKIDELMSIISDNPGKPLVIAAEHRQLIDLAANRLTAEGIEFARITGGVSADERDAAVQAFQTGKIDYILLTFKAGGVGLNLTRADTMIRLQRSWSLIDNNQCVDRIHRIGSEVHESITIIDLVTAGTIEDTQIHRLYEKAERLEEIVRDRAKLAALGKTTDDLDAEEARIEATGLMGA